MEKPADAGSARTGGARREKLVRPPLSPRLAYVRVGLGLLGALLFAFVLEVAVVGTVSHARAQSIADSKLRDTMARSSVPVGQYDIDGNLVPLGTPIARIEIPALGVVATVLEGTTSEILADGPGHRRDSPYPGQVGASLIMGRQSGYGADFGGLSHLRRGDSIRVTTGQGVQQFVVNTTLHAGDKFTADPTKPRLLLISTEGFPFLAERVVMVDATLVGQAVPSPSRGFSAKSLSAAEQARAGDASAALPLFLWAELLLVAALALVWLRAVWGSWQTWLVAAPVLLLCCLQVAHSLAMFLPNLL